MSEQENGQVVSEQKDVMDFQMPTDPKKIIKVIGVGGGGVNAVNYMFQLGIHDVNFAVCNTDVHSFQGVDVPVKVTLGDGLGAGGRPEVAKEKLEQSKDEVKKLFDQNTKMVFITSGMGGGTGSGAAPPIAKMAKDKGILTVGIVTIPFRFEMVPRINKALDAVVEMSKSVDALIVINNERLKEYYPEEDLLDAFKKPDEVLAMAVKSIAEIITVKGIINRDFNDVTSTMKDSGVALISYGFGKGDNRLDDAIQEALDSPLLYNNDIYNAKRILFYISCTKESHFKVDELNKSIDGFMGRFDPNIEMIWGYGIDNDLPEGKEVKFTIITTGFGVEAIPDLKEYVDKEIEGAKKSDDAKKEGQRKRVDDVYGKISPATKGQGKITRVSESSIIILTADELDNDDDTLLTYMEETPTYERKHSEIAKYRQGLKRKEVVEVEKKTPSASKQKVISF